MTTHIPLPLPDPPLRNGTTLLRPWAEADAPHLAAAWADPDVQRWTGVPERHDEVAARRWIAGERERRERGLAIDLVVEHDGVVAGEVGLAHIDARARSAEMGWWIGSDHRGQGLATWAAKAFGQWALGELCLDLLVARCHPDNPASGRVAEAAGFEQPDVAGDLEVWHWC